MALLRTPDEQFTGLPGFEYEPQFVEVGDPRMAYVEAGAGDPILCLHGEPTWSYLYRKMIPGLADEGRVVVPDFIGFGHSDKYTEMDDYSFELQYDALVAFIEKLDLRNITLVCQDWGGMLGLTAAANHPERFARIVPMNTGLPSGRQPMPERWVEFRDYLLGEEDPDVAELVADWCTSDLSPEVADAYRAPFPGPEYKAGVRAWPQLVPTDPDDPGADELAATADALREWDKPAFVLYSDEDPMFAPVRDLMRDMIPTADEQPDVWVEGASHFLQEDRGKEVADHIAAFIERT